MKVFITKFILIVLLCCLGSQVYSQVRVRRGISLPGFRHKQKNRINSSYSEPQKKVLPDFSFTAMNKRPADALDEHFYVKWNNVRALNYDDFRYNRNLYNKFVDDRDSDLINAIYPDYIAFYERLKKRKTVDPMGDMDEIQQARIEKILNAKIDSLQKGFISSASLDMDMSFTISIDSPAASVINLVPVIYALNETTWYFNISAVFNKYESWMIVKSEDILEHEQIHFDIFELFARKMRKHLAETLQKSFSEGMVYDMSTDITPYYEQLYQQLGQMQLDFDKQTGEKTATNQSLTFTNSAWKKILKLQLDQLKDYELPEGKIVLNPAP